MTTLGGKLSREALEVHNHMLTNPGKISSPIKKPLAEAQHAGSRSDHSGKKMVLTATRDNKSDKKSQSGSSVSVPQTERRQGNTGSLFMMKKRLTRWRTGKMSSVSMGSKDRTNLLAVENTYRLEPDEQRSFSTSKVNATIEAVLSEYLGCKEAYDAEQCGHMSRFLAEEIKSRVKALGFARHKVVAQVVIGQDRQQGLQIASRCAWDTDNDNYVTVVFRHKDIFAVATVFGTYFE